ncbi:hypothetical protein BP6252_04818 [Coleophoma cylindrospora]|uniref:Uncharacterized protein n=1 Tax=Coleophoma cylindrospora TaxID=1849047 RepID=A0A3D8S1Z9_9HELO|nr:hypothetical protein BP6252_04818 [Coleophoma cylindrospora]
MANVYKPIKETEEIVGSLSRNDMTCQLIRYKLSRYSKGFGKKRKVTEFLDGSGEDRFKEVEPEDGDKVVMKYEKMAKLCFKHLNTSHLALVKKFLILDIFAEAEEVMQSSFTYMSDMRLLVIPAKVCTLRALPAEVRSRIYEYSLMRTLARPCNQALLTALRPDEKLYHEALAVFNRINYYQLGTSTGMHAKRNLDAFKYVMSDNAIQNIRKMMIYLGDWECGPKTTAGELEWIHFQQHRNSRLGMASNLRSLILVVNKVEELYFASQVLCSMRNLRHIAAVEMVFTSAMDWDQRYGHEIMPNVDDIEALNRRLGCVAKLKRVYITTTARPADKVKYTTEEWFWRAAKGSALQITQ